MFRVIVVTALFLLPQALANCPAGSFIDTDDVCKLCPRDSYNPNPNANSCIECPDNKDTITTGSISLSDCVDCVPGMFLRYEDECETCDPGTFNPLPDQTKCRKCPRGQFSNTYNPVFCRKCWPGRVNNARGENFCELCKGRRYQPNLGKRKCIKCPPGTKTNPDGASCKPKCNVNRPNCFACPPGTQKKKNKCVPCPSGKINKFYSVTKCQKCPEAQKAPFQVPINLVPNAAKTECVCRDGEYLFFEYFGPNELNPFCGDCEPGVGSDGVTCNS